MNAAHTNLSYRPDIDGLRAVAVLGVVLFHAGLGVPGGFVGVDIFFVISGFLITSIILKNLKDGTFSLLDFWERRARRILPALVVVIGAIMIAGWFLLLPGDYASVCRQVLALAAFSSNLRFWRESGYFAEISAEKPMLHTWSLSLEEQFYLLLPLLLLLFFRFRKRDLIASMLVAGMMASFALSVYGSYRNPVATFFLLPTRAWELAAGSLLVLARPMARPFLRGAMAWAGSAAVLSALVFYHPGIRFPGLGALPPVAGAALLIWSGMPADAVDSPPLPVRLLAMRPLVWIGLISYSLYLWHWPLFAFERYLSTSPASMSLRLCLVAAAFLLATLSLKWIETPFRSKGLLRTRRQVFAVSAISVAAIVVAALLILRTGGYPSRVPLDSIRYADSSRDFRYNVRHTIKDIPDKLTTLGVSGSPEVFVWGDSHAMAMLPAVNEACLELGLSAAAATRHGLSPTIGWARANSRATRRQDVDYNKAVFEHIVSQTKKGRLKTVILVARWSIFLEIPEEAGEFESSLRRTIQSLVENRLKVILVKEVPCFPYDVPRKLAIQALFGRNDDLFITREDHLSISRPQSEIFERLRNRHPGVMLIDPLRAQIDSKGRIPAAEAGRSLYKDADHLSSFGSLKLKQPLKEAILSL